MNVPDEVLSDAESSILSNTLLPLPLSQGQCILAEIGQQEIVFPSRWVAEIILIERSKILSLPFYGCPLLGVVYHQGTIMPIISAHLLLLEKLNQGIQLTASKELLSVVRLSQFADHLSGVGIAVDRIVGNIWGTQVSGFESSRWQFQLQDIPDPVWQPQQ
jgi:chemotaxis protein histidine kinase CheA